MTAISQNYMFIHTDTITFLYTNLVRGYKKLYRIPSFINIWSEDIKNYTAYPKYNSFFFNKVQTHIQKCSLSAYFQLLQMPEMSVFAGLEQVPSVIQLCPDLHAVIIQHRELGLQALVFCGVHNYALR